MKNLKSNKTFFGMPATFFLVCMFLLFVLLFFSLARTKAAVLQDGSRAQLQIGGDQLLPDILLAKASLPELLVGGLNARGAGQIIAKDSVLEQKLVGAKALQIVISNGSVLELSDLTGDLGRN